MHILIYIIALDFIVFILVLISLIDQLASAYEKDDLRRRILSKGIIRKKHDRDYTIYVHVTYCMLC